MQEDEVKREKSGWKGATESVMGEGERMGSGEKRGKLMEV